MVVPEDLITQGPCNKTAMVDQCKGVRPKQLPHAESCFAKYPDGEHVILHQGWWVGVTQRCDHEVIEPPSVRPVLLAERHEELLLQIEFENKFSKKVLGVESTSGEQRSWYFSKRVARLVQIKQSLA